VRLSYASHTLITPTGDVEGFFAQIGWRPDQKAGILVFADTRGSWAVRIMRTWPDDPLGLPKTDWLGPAETGATGAISGPKPASRLLPA